MDRKDSAASAVPSCGASDIEKSVSSPADGSRTSLHQQHDEKAASAADEIPYSHRTAWLQVLSGFMLYFNSWGIVTSFGIFQDFYSTTYLPASSNSSISWIGTLQGFLLAIASVFAGPLFDRGHARLLVCLGTFCVVFGLMMTSLCHEYWQFVLAQGVTVGIGAGMMFIVATAVLPGWFGKRMALATGTAATGSSLGGVIYPILFHQLTPQIGFAWTVRVIAFLALFTCLISLCCVKMRALPPPRPRIIDLTGFKEALFTSFAITSFTGGLGLYIPLFYVTEYSAHIGVPSPFVAFMLPIAAAGSIVGRIVPGQLADRFNILGVLTIATASASLLAFTWIAITHSVPGFIIWALLYGAFSGAFVSLQTSIVARCTPDLRMVGGRIGTNNFCTALGVLIGNPVAGAIQAGGDWVGLQVFCAVALGVSAVFSGVTWVLKVRRDREVGSGP